MSDEIKAVKLDVETSLFTMEGRVFLKQLNSVSSVLSISDTQVEFLGDEMVKTGYVGDCKSVQFFQCPKGFFIFCNKAFTKNNWSATGQTVVEVLDKINDSSIREKVESELSADVA